MHVCAARAGPQAQNRAHRRLLLQAGGRVSAHLRARAPALSRGLPHARHARCIPRVMLFSALC